MNNEKINEFEQLIKEGQLPQIKTMVEEGMNIHHGNDYFLYLAVFTKNKKLQKYFIDIGLDPEVTKGRLAVAHPKALANLRKYVIEKDIIACAGKLSNDLPPKNDNTRKIKI